MVSEKFAAICRRVIRALFSRQADPPEGRETNSHGGSKRRREMAMTITHGENEIISISPPSGIDAQILEVSEHPGGSSSRGESQALPGQSEPLGQLGFEDHTKVLQAQGPLAIGQPVFHPFVGYGTIAG